MSRLVSYLLNSIPDRLYICMKYYKHFHRIPHISDPRTFTEKIQWLKLYDRNKKYVTYVDKYLVKNYIASKIGTEYVIPTIAVWNSVDEIDMNALPNQFVIKCTHDSGSIVICKDKAIFNINDAKEKLARGLNGNGYLYGREWPYKNVKARLIAEEYLEDTVTSELRDYKFFCFSGKVKMFKIDFDRFTNHRANYYDRNFNLLPFGEKYLPPDPSRKIIIPDTINKMIELAEILSKGIPFIRVDFYDVNGKIYFGELTLYPGSGFVPFTDNKSDIAVGKWIELPE